MRTLPAGLQAHLDTGATTLAWCWRLRRQDGVTLGFTDHDRDLVFDGTTFEAASGFTATDIQETVGLSVDNLDVEGALRSDRLSENDLSAGLLDGAEIEIFRVNWGDVAQRVLIRSGSLGEVKRGRLSFSAEVRGLAHRLNQEQGRTYQYACDADLGDGRCQVDLASAALRGTGSVTAVGSRRSFSVSGLAAFETDWFRHGLIRWTSGSNANRSMEVRRHDRQGTSASLELWQEMAMAVAVGDAFSITAGCDKIFSTCKGKFANGANFRGFPHMPGNDFVQSYPNRGDASNDGGSRNA